MPWVGDDLGAHLLEFTNGGSKPTARQEGTWNFFIHIAPVWMCTPDAGDCSPTGMRCGPISSFLLIWPTFKAAGAVAEAELIHGVLSNAIPVDALAEHVFVAAAIEVQFARLAAQLDVNALRPVGQGAM